MRHIAVNRDADAMDRQNRCGVERDIQHPRTSLIWASYCQTQYIGFGKWDRGWLSGC